MIIAFFDGSIDINPHGEAGCGIAIYRDHELVEWEGIWIGKGHGMTVNVAEYYGLIYALKWIHKNRQPNEEIIVKGDSMLVIRHMSGTLTPVSGYYLPLYPIAKKLSFGLGAKFVWIPRERNERADEAARAGRLSHGENCTDVDDVVRVHDEHARMQLEFNHVDSGSSCDEVEDSPS